MARAFLCHSSTDKEYVRVVANRLTRARVAFDEFSFQPGQDFRSEILRHLDRSDLFVFFVSPAALASLWCQYELDHAELARMAGGIEGQLALLIDRAVAYSDLPAWLSQARALREFRPSQAARHVENSLSAILAPEQRRPFVGRQDLARAFTSTLDSQGYEPHIFVMTGLEGIGRRSHLARVAQDVIDLPLGPILLLGENSSLEDVFARLFDELTEVNDRSTFAANLVAFRALSTDEQAVEIATQLGAVARARSLPTIVDAGSLMERDSGDYSSQWLAVFDSFSRLNPHDYLAVVQRRRPDVQALAFGDRFVVQRVPPLAEVDIRLLIAQLLRRVGLNAEPAAISELGAFANGYPPSAYFAAAQVAEYGLDATLADKSALIDFRAHRFTRFLLGLALDDTDWSMLRYLAGEASAPLGAIATAVDGDDEDVAKRLRRLVDLSLLLVLDNSYGLSPPISEAVVRARGLLSAQWYSELLHKLQTKYWLDDDILPPLAVIDLTLKAALRSGGGTREYGDLLRVSSIHDVATESYHRRDWEAAVAFGLQAEAIYRAQDDTRRLATVQETVVKALSQLERYDEADDVLRELEARSVRRAWYLRGFLYRRQRRMRDAASALEGALRVGDRSNSVYRDLADVLLRLGETNRARQMIEVVLDRDPDNVFVLDLVARIEIEGADKGRAERALRALERSDVDERFIHHRRATFFQKAHEPQRALEEAERALAVQRHGAAFEVQAVLADILIELEEFARFDALIDELDGRFRTSRRDVRAGLRCKGLVRRRRWREAMAVWETLSEKALPVHRALLASILEVKASDADVPLAQRQQARMEAEGLRSELAGVETYFIEDDPEADGDED